MKTYQEWKDSKKDLGRFLTAGDAVDEDIVDYFIGVLPPIMSKNCIQMGEPCSTNNQGDFVYATLEKKCGTWIYVGYREAGN